MSLSTQPTAAGPGAVVFLSPNDYARTFGISRATTWRRIADKSLTVRRLGPRTVRIAVAAADLVAPVVTQQPDTSEGATAKTSPAKRCARGKGGGQ